MFGSNDTWALSQQLAMYRTMDSWDRNRAESALAANDAAWRGPYNDLVNRYNRLLQDANRLADIQDKNLNSQAAFIAELKEYSETQRGEIERLRLALQASQEHVTKLQEGMRIMRPDLFGLTSNEE